MLRRIIRHLRAAKSVQVPQCVKFTFQRYGTFSVALLSAEKWWNFPRRADHQLKIEYARVKKLCIFLRVGDHVVRLFRCVISMQKLHSGVNCVMRRKNNFHRDSSNRWVCAATWKWRHSSKVPRRNNWSVSQAWKLLRERSKIHMCIDVTCNVGLPPEQKIIRCEIQCRITLSCWIHKTISLARCWVRLHTRVRMQHG